MAKRVQAPQSEAIEEELNRIRKELRELRYENKKMKAIIAQQQKEIRERDEFPILRPPLAARDKNPTWTREMARREQTPERETLPPQTETNTSVGASLEWDHEVGPYEDESMDLDLSGPSQQQIPEKRRRLTKRNEESTARRADSPLPPPPGTKSSGQRGGEGKDRTDNLTNKLDWLVEEIMQIKKVIGKGKKRNPRQKASVTAEKKEKRCDKEKEGGR